LEDEAKEESNDVNTCNDKMSAAVSEGDRMDKVVLPLWNLKKPREIQLQKWVLERDS
jgi:hypothetical protein